MSDVQPDDPFSITRRDRFYVSESGEAVISDSTPNFDAQLPDSIGAETLSIALIGPDEDRRKKIAAALAECQGSEVREFIAYPQTLDDLPRFIDRHCDVVIIDLDSDPEYTLEMVEALCSDGLKTVMVYSTKADPDLLMRCMRAGAREFLTVPLASSSVIAESLVRAAARRPAPRTPKKASGRLLLFMGSKGGVGTTTLASNVAVSLAKDSGESTLLVDFHLPMGDAALNLGIVSDYSTVSALDAFNRLDGRFLSKLLVTHSSGVAVLPSPGRFVPFELNADAMSKLVTVARQEFENVVVDAGLGLQYLKTALFREASTVYLVTQTGIAELRNANRLITQYFGGGKPKLEIVLNRDETNLLGVSEEHVTKALTRQVQWKIPDDYATARRMQVEATPMALGDSQIAWSIRQIASAITGKPLPPIRKKGFSFFG